MTKSISIMTGVVSGQGHVFEDGISLPKRFRTKKSKPDNGNGKEKSETNRKHLKED